MNDHEIMKLHKCIGLLRHAMLQIMTRCERHAAMQHQPSIIDGNFTIDIKKLILDAFARTTEELTREESSNRPDAGVPGSA